MARRKRTSKRRWKARCDLHRLISRQAIVEHRLDRWFVFAPSLHINMDVTFAVRRLGHDGWWFPVEKSEARHG